MQFNVIINIIDAMYKIIVIIIIIKIITINAMYKVIIEGIIIIRTSEAIHMW